MGDANHAPKISGEHFHGQFKNCEFSPSEIWYCAVFTMWLHALQGIRFGQICLQNCLISTPIFCTLTPHPQLTSTQLDILMSFFTPDSAIKFSNGGRIPVTPSQRFIIEVSYLWETVWHVSSTLLLHFLLLPILFPSSFSSPSSSSFSSSSSSSSGRCV